MITFVEEKQKNRQKKLSEMSMYSTIQGLGIERLIIFGFKIFKTLFFEIVGDVKYSRKNS